MKKLHVFAMFLFFLARTVNSGSSAESQSDCWLFSDRTELPQAAATQKTDSMPPGNPRGFLEAIILAKKIRSAILYPSLSDQLDRILNSFNSDIPFSTKDMGKMAHQQLVSASVAGDEGLLWPHVDPYFCENEKQLISNASLVREFDHLQKAKMVRDNYALLEELECSGNIAARTMQVEAAARGTGTWIGCSADDRFRELNRLAEAGSKRAQELLMDTLTKGLMATRGCKPEPSEFLIL